MREIVEHFDISERTAYRDLAALDRRNIPLYRDEHGYKLVEGATLRPLNLTAEERALLRLALDNPALRERPGLARRLRTLRAKLDAVTRAAEETPPTMTRTITVTYDGETLRPSGPLDLERGRPYRVTLEKASRETGGRDAWSELERLTGTVNAPQDWAHEHDHYLYGSPKRGTEGRE